MLSKLKTLLFLLSILLFCHTEIDKAWATEGGGGAYPNGAEDFMAGAVPPPGTYFINYFTYYTAGAFKDNEGNDAIPDFDLKVIANTFRILHVTKMEVLGANWGFHAFLPIVNVDVILPVGSESKTGVGDIIIDPFILAWHLEHLHFVAAMDIYMPTGSYDKDRLANIGRNYWTFEPIFAFTYLSKSGFEVSAKLMYDFNTKNEDTDYKSGQEFHFDYTLGMKLKEISFGVGGYFYQQVTKDEINGQTIEPNGNKGRAFAVGPQIKYDYKNMSFILKYQKEMFVENRPEGDKLWFKFVWIF